MQAPTSWEAAFLANKVAFGYQNLDTELSRGEINQVVGFLENQISKIDVELKESEEDLRHFQQKTGVVALPEESQKMVDQVIKFQSSYKEAETELETNKTKFQELLTNAKNDTKK